MTHTTGHIGIEWRSQMTSYINGPSDIIFVSIHLHSSCEHSFGRILWAYCFSANFHFQWLQSSCACTYTWFGVGPGRHIGITHSETIKSNKVPDTCISTKHMVHNAHIKIRIRERRRRNANASMYNIMHSILLMISRYTVHIHSHIMSESIVFHTVANYDRCNRVHALARDSITYTLHFYRFPNNMHALDLGNNTGQHWATVKWIIYWLQCAICYTCRG